VRADVTDMPRSAGVVCPLYYPDESGIMHVCPNIATELKPYGKFGVSVSVIRPHFTELFTTRS
jgi:hypothetical protein